MADTKPAGFGQQLAAFLNSPESMGLAQGLLSSSRDQYGRPQRFGPAFGAGLESMAKAGAAERLRKLQEDYFGLAQGKFGLEQEGAKQKALQQQRMDEYFAGLAGGQGGSLLNNISREESQAASELGLLNSGKGIDYLSQAARQPEILKLAKAIFPEDEKAQRDFIIEYKTKPLVNIGEQARSEIDKKRFNELYANTANNVKIKGNIVEMKNILSFLESKGVRTGYGSGKVLLGRQFVAAALADVVDPEVTAALEKYQSLSKRLFVEQLKGIGARGQNIFSEKRVVAAIPELEKTIEGNRRILNAMEAEVNKSDAKLDLFEDFYDEKGTSSKFDRSWREYLANHPELSGGDRFASQIYSVESNRKILIVNSETGEKKYVTEEEAKEMGVE